MSTYEEALTRINTKYVENERAGAEIRRQVKEAKAALDALGWEDKEVQRAKRRIAEQTKVLQHVIGGSCFHQMPGRNVFLDLCPKPAQKTCEECGGPFCGIHNKVSKHGIRAHSCQDWTAFKRTVIDGLPPLPSRWETLGATQVKEEV